MMVLWLYERMPLFLGKYMNYLGTSYHVYNTISNGSRKKMCVCACTGERERG